MFGLIFDRLCSTSKAGHASEYAKTMPGLQSKRRDPLQQVLVNHTHLDACRSDCQVQVLEGELTKAKERAEAKMEEMTEQLHLNWNSWRS